MNGDRPASTERLRRQNAALVLRSLRQLGPATRAELAQRTALGTPLTNPSPLGGAERISVYTTILSNGSLFYFFTVAPETDAQVFQQTFTRIGQSIRLNDGR